MKKHINFRLKHILSYGNFYCRLNGKSFLVLPFKASLNIGRCWLIMCSAFMKATKNQTVNVIRTGYTIAAT